MLLSGLQVVVDTEATAKALLSRGQLRNRVTIIPLNKARPRPLQRSQQLTQIQLRTTPVPTNV